MGNKYWVNGWGSSSGESNYTPNAYDTNVAKATSRYYSDGYCAPWHAVNPSNSLTGSYVGNTWMGVDPSNQRHNTNITNAKIVNRVYYENYHHSGGNTTRGVNAYRLYGSNTDADFTTITYFASGDKPATCTLLASGNMVQHTASNVADPQYIDIANNTTAYKYFIFCFETNHGDASYIGIRRIEFQTMHWSSSSGGAGSFADIPVSTDNLIFDANSGISGASYQANLDGTCHDITLGKPSSGHLTLWGSLNVTGSISISNGTTVIYGGNCTITMTSTTGTETLSCSGGVLFPNLVFNGVGGIFQLSNTLNVGGNLTLTAGTFAHNNQAIVFYGNSDHFITGAFTFYDFYIWYDLANNYVSLANDITIARNLYSQGTGVAVLLTLKSTDINEQRTVTVNGSIYATYTRFGGIDLQGTASPLYCDATCGEIMNNTNILLIGTKTWVKG